MKKSNSLFFSKILYKNINDVTGSIIGKLSDLILDFSSTIPMVKAIEIKNGKRKLYVSSDNLEILNDGNSNYSIKLNTQMLNVMAISYDDFFVARDFLDKQIVDINGKKVERVNDVMIGLIRGDWKIVAVDIGLRGILRRLGIEYPAILFAGTIKKEFRNKLVYWENVQPLSERISSLQLFTSMNRLTTMHAADIADIIEELDKQNQIKIFHSLDNEKAAQVLEEMEEDFQLSLLETLPDEKASNILEIMPADEAADILEEITNERAERLLVQMESENSTDIRELMEYDEKTAGSLMTKDYISFVANMRIGMVLEELKKLDLKENFSQYIYLTNEKEIFLGFINLLDVVVADPNLKLNELSSISKISIYDENKIDKAMDLSRKYNLLELPVVDENDELVGVVSLNDLLEEYIRLRRSVA